MNALELSTVSWRKSSHSTNTGGDCVELAEVSCMVVIRDSKHPEGPVLGFGRAAFADLTRQIQAGRYDR